MSSEVIFKDNSPEVLKKMEQAIEAGLTACAMTVHEQAVLLAKGIVDTGRLSDSITYKVGNKTVGKGLETEVKEGEAIIGTNVFYAPYIELGTGVYAKNGDGRKTPWTYFNERKNQFFTTIGYKPRPFLRPAFDAVGKSLNAIFNKEYNRIMK